MPSAEGTKVDMINLQVFLLTLEQVGILVIFILIGYMLNRFKIIGDVKSLSTVLVWVFMPAVVFNVFYKNFTLTNLSTALPFVLAGLVMLAVLVGGSFFIIRRFKDRITRNTYWYSLVITNISYVGFTLMKNVFPQYELFFMVFVIPMHMFIYTFGVAMLKPQAEKVTVKGLLSPMMVALLIGIVCGLVFDATNVTLPNPVEKICTSAANCMSPTAMLITGFTLAKLPISKVFTGWFTYLFAFLRLIMYPLVFGGIAYLAHIWFGLPINIVRIIIIYTSLPAGINPVVFAEAGGADGTVGAQSAFITHALCIATLPFVFSLVTVL